MPSKRSLQVAPIVLGFLAFCSIRANAQRELGELRVEVQDQQGAPVVATLELVSDCQRGTTAVEHRRPGADSTQTGPRRRSNDRTDLHAIGKLTFASAQVEGEEVRVEVPKWGRFWGAVSYTNQIGFGRGPITGGLFLGDDASSAPTDVSRFPISQDQRNTLNGRLRVQAVPRLWFALGAGYGSGLPVDLGNGPVDVGFLLAQYGAAVVDRVNFATGRSRSSFSLDAGAGVDLYRRDLRTLSLQVQTTNLTDRVNVINFASLFSGTAIGPSRSLSARFRATF